MWSKFRVLAFVLFIVPNTVWADNIWNVTGTFFDAETGKTSALSGTITTTLIDFSDQSPYYENYWTYARQNITSINIVGADVPFHAASFGGGAVDLCDESGNPDVCASQIILQDGVRFTDYQANNAFSGTMLAPTMLALFDMFPFMGTGGTLGIQADDRMSLFMTETPHPPAIPEPGTLALMGSGLVGVWTLRRRCK